MFKKYIMLFVLVIVMIKANSQTYPYYYHRDIPLNLTESNDILLVKVISPSAEDLMNAKVANDADFSLLAAVRGHYLLQRKDGSVINSQAAVDNYLSEPFVHTASFVFANDNGTFQGISDQVNIRLKSTTSFDQLESLASAYDVVEISPDAYMNRVYKLFISKGNPMSTLAISNELFETGLFEFAEPNFLFTTYSHVANPVNTSAACNHSAPNDQYYSLQWNLNQSTALSPGLVNEDINVCNAWSVKNRDQEISNVDGSGIKVAVIDDDVDMSHPDLQNVVGYYDATHPSNCPSTQTPPGYIGYGFLASNTHGTHCAGIIGATKNNSIGVAGIAEGASIYGVRIFFNIYNLGCPNSASFLSFTDWAACGINYAVNDFNVDILNCSWGGSNPYNLIDNAIDNAVQNGRNGKGCIVVFSTGNDNNSNIIYPSSHEAVIAVGASTMCGERKRSSSDPDGVSCDNENWGSNYGTGTGFGGSVPATAGYISVVAPGVKIPTTALSGPPGWYYSCPSIFCPSTNPVCLYNVSFGGTSAAAPHVAATAALMLEANPCLTVDEVKQILKRTANKISGPAVNPYSWTNYLFANDPDGTWEPQVGYGRLNAGNAVTWAHDMYRQNESVNYTQTYAASHKIFAGDDVDMTNLTPVGAYTINPGADITFNAPDGISLYPGFESIAGSYFTAQIANQTPCINNVPHYKPTKHKNELVLSQLTEGNAVSSVSIFPNPVQDNLKISMVLSEDSNIEYYVSNMMGQVVVDIKTKTMLRGKNIESVSTQSLIPGMYIINIKTNTSVNTFQFVKE